MDTRRIQELSEPRPWRSLAQALAENPPGARLPSPCINVCRVDSAAGLCVGCGRTLDEIAAWSSLDDQQRLAVWVRLEAAR